MPPLQSSHGIVDLYSSWNMAHSLLIQMPRFHAAVNLLSKWQGAQINVQCLRFLFPLRLTEPKCDGQRPRGTRKAGLGCL